MEVDPFKHPIVTETFYTSLALLNAELATARDHIKLLLTTFINTLCASKHSDVMVKLEYGPLLITMTIETTQKDESRIEWKTFFGSLSGAQQIQQTLYFLVTQINKS